MATMKRCLAQLSLSGSWGTQYLWPDLEVDLERELAPGFTVADAVRGREDCFEDVASEPVPTMLQPGERVVTAADAPHEE
jgi:hypothetical protein